MAISIRLALSHSLKLKCACSSVELATQSRLYAICLAAVSHFTVDQVRLHPM